MDLSHTFGQPLVIVNGALVLVDGADLVNQRLLKRLLTNPGDYIMDLSYGAGLGQRVGQPVNTDALTALVLNQLKLESTVVQSPSPVVTLYTDNIGAVFCSVAYTYVPTSQGVLLNFSVGNNGNLLEVLS